MVIRPGKDTLRRARLSTQESHNVRSILWGQPYTKPGHNGHIGQSPIHSGNGHMAYGRRAGLLPPFAIWPVTGGTVAIEQCLAPCAVGARLVLRTRCPGVIDGTVFTGRQSKHQRQTQKAGRRHSPPPAPCIRVFHSADKCARSSGRRFHHSCRVPAGDSPHCHQTPGTW